MSKISVIMPAYNCEKYVGLAIESVLAQTMSDFELIVLNDGSTDATEQVVMSYKDARIKYYKNDRNQGLTYTRNKLMQLCSAEFIAFLDSDDLAEPTRFEEEYNELIKDDRLGFVSSSFYGIDKSGKLLDVSVWKTDLSPEELKVRLLFYNPVATSSVMLRRAALPDVIFREGYPVCEDYDLWTRMLQNWNGRVLPKILMRYRLYDDSICKQQPENIVRIRNKIVLNQLEMYFAGAYSEQESLIQLGLVDFNLLTSKDEIQPLSAWILKLQQLNQKQQHFDPRILSQVLYERVLKKFLRLDGYDRSVYRTLQHLKRTLQPRLTWELRKKELAILAFSLAGKKFIATD